MSFGRRKNPKDKAGNTMTCRVCGSDEHFQANCPRKGNAPSSSGPGPSGFYSNQQPYSPPWGVSFMTTEVQTTSAFNLPTLNDPSLLQIEDMAPPSFMLSRDPLWDGEHPWAYGGLRHRSRRPRSHDGSDRRPSPLGNTSDRYVGRNPGTLSIPWPEHQTQQENNIWSNFRPSRYDNPTDVDRDLLTGRPIQSPTSDPGLSGLDMFRQIRQSLGHPPQLPFSQSQDVTTNGLAGSAPASPIQVSSPPNID